MSPFLSLTSVDLDRLCGIIIFYTKKCGLSLSRAINLRSQLARPFEQEEYLSTKRLAFAREERGARSEERAERSTMKSVLFL